MLARGGSALASRAGRHVLAAVAPLERPELVQIDIGVAVAVIPRAPGRQRDARPRPARIKRRKIRPVHIAVAIGITADHRRATGAVVLRAGDRLGTDVADVQNTLSPRRQRPLIRERIVSRVISGYASIMSTDVAIPLPTPGNSANCRWIQAQWAQLLRDYPDQWIAVDQDRVLAAGRNLGEVANTARRAGASGDVAYEFVAGASLIF